MNKDKEKACLLIRQCLTELYQASEPPITFEECEKRYIGVDDWQRKHVITTEKYTEIRDKYYKLLPKVYHFDFELALLDYSPMEKV